MNQQTVFPGNLRKVLCIALSACMVALLGLVAPAAAQAKTYTQKGDALAKYDVSKYKTVKNAKMSSTYSGGYRTDTSGKLTTKKGTKVTFRSWMKLNSGENMQSFVVSSTGNTAWALITKSRSNSNGQRGWIRKYDLAAIKSHYRTSIKKHSAFTPSSKYYKDGAVFTTGHGQALAYNPKTAELVNVQANKVVNSNVQLIDKNTLTPSKSIKFRLKSTVKMGNNLAFDKRGNAYFYTRSNGGWAPKNSIKIYKGKFNFKTGKVKFKLVMQGLRNPMGKIGQGLGYNAANDRLYLVDNGQITSVPCSKLGKLKPKDVRQTLFNGKREFQAIAFTSGGTCYLNICNPREIMIATNAF